MAAINPSSALRACRFMQRCRQARRHSSTVSSSLLSRYDPSNFTRARGPHRFPPLAPSPPAPQTTPPDDTTPRPLRAHPSTPPTSPSQTTISTLRASTPIPWGTRLLRFARLSRPPPPATDPTDTTPFNAYTNPYRAHKAWPPDVPSLHPKEQFRFEKTYRRRSKLKWARPRWNRRVKLLQHTLMVSVLIYFVFIAEPRDMGTPFDGFRVWFYGKLKDLTALPEGSRAEAARLQEESRVIKDQRARKRWFGSGTDDVETEPEPEGKRVLDES